MGLKIWNFSEYHESLQGKKDRTGSIILGEVAKFGLDAAVTHTHPGQG